MEFKWGSNFCPGGPCSISTPPPPKVFHFACASCHPAPLFRKSQLEWGNQVDVDVNLHLDYDSELASAVSSQLRLNCFFQLQLSRQNKYYAVWENSAAGGNINLIWGYEGIISKAYKETRDSAASHASVCVTVCFCFCRLLGHCVCLHH